MRASTDQANVLHYDTSGALSRPGPVLFCPNLTLHLLAFIQMLLHSSNTLERRSTVAFEARGRTRFPARIKWKISEEPGTIRASEDVRDDICGYICLENPKRNGKFVDTFGFIRDP